MADEKQKVHLLESSTTSAPQWVVCTDDFCTKTHQYWGNSDWSHPRWGD
jgi:hypothetical protein